MEIYKGIRIYHSLAQGDRKKVLLDRRVSPGLFYSFYIMKGDVYMTNEYKKNLEELRKRALKRSISFSSTPKTAEDVKIENDFYKIVENQIYNQIVRK